MRLDGKTRLDRSNGGIGLDLGGIDIEFSPLHQSCCLTLLHNFLKEAAKDLDSIPLTDTGQTGMVGQRLAQVIPQVPQHAEAIGCMPHELPLRAYPLKKHDELQFEEDHRINGGTTSTSIRLLHELTDKREIKGALHMAIKVIWRY
jgi:hypothetical protein